MESDNQAVKSATVTYEFALSGAFQGTCSATVVVSATAATHSNGDTSGLGYSITAPGSFSLNVAGAQPVTLTFIKHYPGGQDYQVLWADGGGIGGGSSKGLSQQGPYLGGGLPSLSWDGGSGFFFSNGTTTNYPLTLVTCTGWPPTA